MIEHYKFKVVVQETYHDPLQEKDPSVDKFGKYTKSQKVTKKE